MGGKSPVNASEDERALVDLSVSRDRAEEHRPWAIVMTLSG